jgi:uncharacterized protein YacL
LKGTHTNRWLDVLNEIQETRQKKLEAKKGKNHKRAHKELRKLNFLGV